MSKCHFLQESTGSHSILKPVSGIMCSHSQALVDQLGCASPGPTRCATGGIRMVRDCRMFGVVWCSTVERIGLIPAIPYPFRFLQRLMTHPLGNYDPKDCRRLSLVTNIGTSVLALLVARTDVPVPVAPGVFLELHIEWISSDRPNGRINPSQRFYCIPHPHAD